MNRIRVKNEIFSTTNFCNKGWQHTFVPPLSEVFDTVLVAFIFSWSFNSVFNDFFNLRSTIANLVKK
jgi:hypothetical protein